MALAVDARDSPCFASPMSSAEVICRLLWDWTSTPPQARVPIQVSAYPSGAIQGREV